MYFRYLEGDETRYFRCLEGEETMYYLRCLAEYKSIACTVPVTQTYTYHFQLNTAQKRLPPCSVSDPYLHIPVSDPRGLLITVSVGSWSGSCLGILFSIGKKYVVKYELRIWIRIQGASKLKTRRIRIRTTGLPTTNTRWACRKIFPLTTGWSGKYFTKTLDREIWEELPKTARWWKKIFTA